MLKKKTYVAVFGLGFEIGYSRTTKSGFEPITDPLGRNFSGDARLPAFEALLRSGIAKKLILLGMNQENGIHSALAIEQILIHDYGVDSAKVEAVPIDTRTTAQNILAIPRVLVDKKMLQNQCAVVTVFRHVPRTAYFMASMQLSMPVLPAEAIILAAAPTRAARDALEQALRAELQRPKTADDEFFELRGISQLIDGSYESFR